MVIDINNQFRIAGVWLSKDENNDPEIKQRILSFFSENKKKKYVPVIYISGDKDFKWETICLLKHNL